MSVCICLTQGDHVVSSSRAGVQCKLTTTGGGPHVICNGVMAASCCRPGCCMLLVTKLALRACCGVLHVQGLRPFLRVIVGLKLLRNRRVKCCNACRERHLCDCCWLG